MTAGAQRELENAAEIFQLKLNTGICEVVPSQLYAPGQPRARGTPVNTAVARCGQVPIFEDQSEQACSLAQRCNQQAACY